MKMTKHAEEDILFCLDLVPFVCARCGVNERIFSACLMKFVVFQECVYTAWIPSLERKGSREFHIIKVIT